MKPAQFNEQEPVAKAVVSKRKTDEHHITDIDLTLTEAGKLLNSGEHLLYTTPPTQQSCSQRPSRSDMTWVGLMDEDVVSLCREFMSQFDKREFIKATEAKLKEKNT